MSPTSEDQVSDSGLGLPPLIRRDALRYSRRARVLMVLGLTGGTYVVGLLLEINDGAPLGEAAKSVAVVVETLISLIISFAILRFFGSRSATAVRPARSALSDEP